VEALGVLRDMLMSPGEKGKPEDVLLLVAGHGGHRLARELPFQTKSLGFLRDEIALALAYQAADIFVCPSVEDGGPLMIPQAMMCGRPVVSFRSGYALDLVKTMQTGYLCENTDSTELAHGICRTLFSDRLREMGENARRLAAERHARPVFLAHYLGLCEELLGRTGPAPGNTQERPST